jgi:hypothetical protein
MIQTLSDLLVFCGVSPPGGTLSICPSHVWTQLGLKAPGLNPTVYAGELSVCVGGEGEFCGHVVFTMT